MSILLILGFVNSASSQIYGDGNIKTMSQKVPNLTSIEIDFNANLKLDYNLEEEMIIDADANVLEWIGITFENGNLKLDQKKWIEPSKLPTITIGSPNLKSVYQSTHSTTTVSNVTGSVLYLKGNVGKIIAEGMIDDLYIDTENTDIDARNLEVGTVYISEMCRAYIQLEKYKKLNREDNSKSMVEVGGSPLNLDKKTKSEKGKKNAKPVKYIKFKIKNNSMARHSYYVKGPNGRGGKFSYGFSMFPLTTRDENWSVGTKIYKEGRFGKLTELITITESDEGKVVDLFK